MEGVEGEGWKGWRDKGWKGWRDEGWKGWRDKGWKGWREKDGRGGGMKGGRGGEVEEFDGCCCVIVLSLYTYVETVGEEEEEGWRDGRVRVQGCWRQLGKGGGGMER